MQMRQKRQKSEIYDAPVSEISYLHCPPFFRELRCSLICFMKTINSIEELKSRASAAKNVGPCICLRHIRCVTVQRVPGTGAMHGMSIAMDDWWRGWAGAARGEPDTPL